MNFYKIFVAVVGSVLFIPVSCMVITVAGTPAVSWLDARNTASGDTIHSPFSVVAELKNDREKVIVLTLDEMASQLKKLQEPVSFLLSRPRGTISTDKSRYEYRVLENKAGQQHIEVVNIYLDGDNTIWGCYRATEDNISPLTSRMFYFGYMFRAMLFAFILSLAIFAFGRFLKRRYAKDHG